jgi:hypothetical protein
MRYFRPLCHNVKIPLHKGLNRRPPIPLPPLFAIPSYGPIYICFLFIILKDI